MLKLLHTSDWHLGQTFCNFDRADENAHFLAQLADIVGREQPDAMVVAGDVFNVPTPSASALRLFTEGLLAVCRRAPLMDVFVTAGNHDSAYRLEADSELWRGFRVRVHGVVAPDCSNVAGFVHRVEGKAVVAAVPYFNPRSVSPNDVFAAVDDAVRSVNADGLPVVYMAHAALSGSDTTGHDDPIGGMEMEALATFGVEYDYLALGHIHCPQTLKGSGGKVRYCGTPVAVSFDERYPHGVDIVTISHGLPPQVRTVKIEPLRQMLTVPCDPVPFDDALAQLALLPDDSDAYVCLNVLVDKFLPADAQAKALEAVRGKACRFCKVKVSRRESVSDSEAKVNAMHMAELRAIDPVDVARMTWRDANGDDMGDDIVALLRSVVDEVKEAEK